MMMLSNFFEYLLEMLKDFFKGPSYKQQVHRMESELGQLQKRYEYAASELKQLKEKYLKLLDLAKTFSALDAVQIDQEIEKRNKILGELKDAIAIAKQEQKNISTEVDFLHTEVLVLEEAKLLESFALYIPKFKFTSSLQYKQRLDGIRSRQKEMIKSGSAATGNMNWAVNGKKSEGKKLVTDMIKLLLQSFNNECDHCIDNVKFDNIELGEKRILQSFDVCNKLGRVMNVSLSNDYLALKIDELRLAHEFQVKRQEEKEEAKRVREELREQQKIEQEIRSAREKILKERKHFTGALRDLHLRLEKSPTREGEDAIKAKISEIEASNSALENEEKLIDYREQNAKAGYVYVISNIGAFGENVYKIGMTRRLDSMERIEELGDASVPFWFDVHALVFSDNAPALEAKLHEHFSHGRINKINTRKEFFRASIDEIEEVIRRHYDPAVEVTREASAEQYRESLRIAA